MYCSVLIVISLSVSLRGSPAPVWSHSWLRRGFSFSILLPFFICLSLFHYVSLSLSPSFSFFSYGFFTGMTFKGKMWAATFENGYEKRFKTNERNEKEHCSRYYKRMFRKHVFARNNESMLSFVLIIPFLKSVYFKPLVHSKYIYYYNLPACWSRCVILT